MSDNLVTEKKDYDFYGFGTSNAYKIKIFFDLLGISYNYHVVDILKGEQFKPEFLKLNPNNKVPVIVDNTISPPLVVFESGAILIYLAEKHGKFLPDQTHPRERSEVLQWVAWQISTQGPYIGQYAHFLHYAPEKIPYAIERYEKETHRIYSVLDGHLSTRKYVAGGELSIADIAIYGWALYLHIGIVPGYDTKYLNVVKWLNTLEALPEFKNTLDYAIAFKKSMAAKAAAAAAAAKQE